MNITRLSMPATPNRVVLHNQLVTNRMLAMFKRK
ncbi:NAD(P) transhydrogenase subunit alpha [Shewanella salipaludis]|uniref:NAD(P) transhydrogenase subunit alpha n=1 Tax=Shewanella salipaludis TaxID=2723052 RepID=A0A972G6H6_9GAMM|nr:NAD(P) transhydrogenase subunit alpha [Shewanella salipaludis]NMH65385.1 NAD(P) transhydrogenase subunit alpha [Shewanella salipaludis]